MKQSYKSPVSVVFPEIKLNISDLAYMNGLLPGGIRCYPKDKVTDKLKFLGLIEMADIPVCPKALAKYHQGIKDHEAGIFAAVKARNWKDTYDHAYHLKNPPSMPGPKMEMVLTKAGLEFMRRGKAMTQTVTKEKACL